MISLKLFLIELINRKVISIERLVGEWGRRCFSYIKYYDVISSVIGESSHFLITQIRTESTLKCDLFEKNITITSFNDARRSRHQQYLIWKCIHTLNKICITLWKMVEHSQKAILCKTQRLYNEIINYQNTPLFHYRKFFEWVAN